MTGVKGRSGTNGGGKTGQASHRQEQERLKHRELVAKYMRMGWTQGMIAAELRVSQSTVYLDYKFILQEMVDNRVKDTEALVQQKLMEWAEIKAEAWRAWHRSWEDHQRVTEDKAVSSPQEGIGGDENGKGKSSRKGKTAQEIKAQQLRARITKVTEGRLPLVDYLRVIMECNEQEQALQGLNPAKQLSVKGQVTTATFDWNTFAQLDPLAPIPDEVAAVIRQQLAYARGDGPSKNAQGLVVDPETGAGVLPQELTVGEARELLKQAGMVQGEETK